MNEMDIVSLFYFILGALFLLPALWSLDPKHLGSAVGTLANSKKVLRRRSRHSDRQYPATACTYIYEVGGKCYRLKRSGFFARSGLMRKITVVYLKGLPRFGHLERYPAGAMSLIGGIAIAGGILFLLMNEMRPALLVPGALCQINSNFPFNPSVRGVGMVSNWTI